MVFKKEVLKLMRKGGERRRSHYGIRGRLKVILAMEDEMIKAHGNGDFEKAERYARIVEKLENNSNGN